MKSQDLSVCNEEVYQQVYTEQAEPLRNFMYYKSGDLNQAEDLMHEAFIKLWENCGKVVFEKARAFLFTVSGNLFINQIRHRKIVLSFEKENKNGFDNQDPSFQLEQKEFKAKLEEAISGLTEAQREVFLMNRIDNLKYAEIAEILGISVKAVEKRIHKALVNLKERVSELKERKV